VTIIVGYQPDKGGRSSLELATLLARSGRKEPLAVVTVVPQHWSTPSMAKVDGEYADWANQQGRAALATAQAYLVDKHPDEDVSFHQVSGRSIQSALLQACKDLGGDLLVLGSSSDGRVGQVVVGSTAEPLLHSSDVPIAIAPRGYRTGAAGLLTRLTCSFSGTQESKDLLLATAQMSLRVGGRLRIVTFGVRGRTMYPPEVGLRAEDMVLQSWTEQVTADQEKAVKLLRGYGLLPEHTTKAIATGASWVDVMDELEWEPGEVLVVGSSPIGPLARVFLGSRAIKIVRYSPVPVIVVPAGIAKEEAADAVEAAAEAGPAQTPPAR
jgi:nucleotide-binding universal stress UspA family protein